MATVNNVTKIKSKFVIKAFRNRCGYYLNKDGKTTSAFPHNAEIFETAKQACEYLLNHYPLLQLPNGDRLQHGLTMI